MNTRLLTLKSILWALVGMLAVVTLARFFHGLGATTNLTDVSPWGIWIGFDVMGGVALAAGGFVLAATVYIFGLEKYRPFVRPAILTAFLGYIAVATGLLYDLGLPWNIWHPMLFPQHHSVLFEVAMCAITGGDEILLPESLEMTERLQAAGVDARLYVEDGMWHVYPLYPVPEARTAQAMVRDFLGEEP